MSPGFKKKLRKATTIFLREMRDGCVDCIAEGNGAYCVKHNREAMQVILEPRTHKEFTEFFKGFK